MEGNRKNTVQQESWHTLPTKAKYQIPLAWWAMLLLGNSALPSEHQEGVDIQKTRQLCPNRPHGWTRAVNHMQLSQAKNYHFFILIVCRCLNRLQTFFPQVVDKLWPAGGGWWLLPWGASLSIPCHMPTNLCLHEPSMAWERSRLFLISFFSFF